eukprot:CAMPEP_0174253804 /NCGR_PEP_ID=MMETSP0439-20130205/3160_1 /TAXON_ID=0 /ORGANISM="Stereomyxa ramosa, Strain Chinc5" /LENGTH=190 /DNA_ID=CAMNT_0015335037 /DNA_START=234 /DNA_END=806 /DNA_ORIENTATION=-
MSKGEGYFLLSDVELSETYADLFAQPTYTFKHDPQQYDDMLTEMMTLIDEQPVEPQHTPDHPQDVEVEYYSSQDSDFQTNPPHFDENINDKMEEDQDQNEDNRMQILEDWDAEELYRCLAAALPNPVKLHLCQQPTPDLLSSFDCRDANAIHKLAASVSASLGPSASYVPVPVGSGLLFCKRRPRVLDFF